MKLKLVSFDGYGTSAGITIGKFYEVSEVFDGIYEDCYEFIDDHCELHKLRKTCFEEQSSEWTGEGLPPVGEIVRHIETENSVEIVCYFHGSIVYWDFKIGGFHSGTANDFKPIKSEKDKEIEKIFRIISHEDDYWDAAEKLYENGFRFVEKS